MSINRNKPGESVDELKKKKNISQMRNSLKWIDNLKNVKRQSLIDNNKQLFTIKTLKNDEMIKKAKIHREANRPLMKIKEFDGNTKFCQCCYLPSNDNKYLKNFNFCENTDKFAECGRGTSLYYSFYRFSSVILLLATISMALPSFFLTSYYTDGLTDICYKIYQIENEKINITFPDCINFININGISEYFIKDTNWELKYNAINLVQYRQIYHKLTNSYDNIDNILVNYNISHFICLLTLFIINLLYIIFLYNINIKYDISVTSPSDFTVIISNLYSAFHIFWKKINKINNYIINKNENNDKDSNNKNRCENKKENQKEPAQIEMKEIEELGLEDFPQEKEINILEAFNTFIKNKICETSNGEKFNIYQINICYKISEFMKIEDKIQNKKRMLYKFYNDPKQKEKNEKLHLKNNDRKYFYYPLDLFGLNIFRCDCCEKFYLLSDIEEEKNNLESKLKELLKQTENLNEDNFSGVIFVTFNNIKEQEKFLKPYPKNLIMNILVSIKNLKYFLCCCFVNKKKRKRFLLKKNIAVDVAPEPEDVIFENLQYSSINRFFRILLIYFISFIIIFICFIIILALNYLQLKHKEGHSSNKTILKYLVSLVITLVISCLNSIFQNLLNILTKKERQISMTNYYLSFSVKLTIFTFTTSGIIPLISSYYHNANYDLLVANMLTLFLSNSFLTPIMWSINFEFLLKKIKICLVEKKCEYYTQKELNELYELLDMRIATKYSYISKTLLMSFLYMPIFPLSIIISLVGFIFGYFIEKINFSKMYKRPEMLNSKICEFYSNYFILNFFMLSVGDYIFISDISDSSIWPLFNLILFAILFLIPYNQIFAFNFIGINESQIKKNQTYEDYFFNFYNDYERINPMTKKEGIKHFFSKLMENGLITNIEYNIILNNFDKINLMETYYKARLNFSNTLIQRAFLSLGGKNKNNANRRKSKYIENFKEYVKKNGSKDINFLFFLENNQNKDNQNNNHIHRVNSLNSNSNNTFQLNNSFNSFDCHKQSGVNVIDLRNQRKSKFIEESDKINIKRRSLILMENMINREQNKILNLYNNPLFFGIRVLFDSIYLNKDEENEDKKKEENDIEVKNNNNLEYKAIGKKKRKKKKKKKKKKEELIGPIIIYTNENYK